MKQEPIIILSLFDGISCGQEAISRILPPGMEYIYYASEVDKAIMKVTQHHYPNTIQLGDVRNITRDMIPGNVFMVIGGSPCQSFSFAGRRKGMVTEENIEITSLHQYMKLKNEGFEFIGQSYLYWEFVRIVRMFNPTYFMLENVKMYTKWENIISNGLGVTPMKMNSSLVSAQNRLRLYWTNIPGVTPPQDRKIYFDEVVPAAKGYGIRGVKKKKTDLKYTQTPTTRKDRKANCLVCTDNTTQKLIFPNGEIRQLNPTEREILQTLPVGYTDVPGLTKTQRVHATGNCWTVDMVSHIFSYIPELKTA